MELVEDKNLNNFNIKKYVNRTIFLIEKTYSEPVVFHDNSILPFHVKEPSNISLDDIEVFISTSNLILIGTGEKNVLLNQDLIKIMQISGKGLEFMNTESACKTHNLLLSERRLFTSILYP
ncbi:MAG: Mth938-like domain-containing protein [Pseudomonadota bacterium]|nr:Mth938-like domain-containing protein [Pseudomonadota bacterium]